MIKRMKRPLLMLMLAAVMASVCACRQNPSQEQLYARMFAHFGAYGFACSLQPVAEDQPVPIYKAKAWQTLKLDNEEVLVYFDDSNRADYLSTFVDAEAFGTAWPFGLRFVLVYDGDDARVLEALNAIENE